MRTSAWLALCATAFLVPAIAADGGTVPTPPQELTAEQDHQLMLRQLGIASIRQGANGRERVRLSR